MLSCKLSGKNGDYLIQPPKSFKNNGKEKHTDDTLMQRLFKQNAFSGLKFRNRKKLALKLLLMKATKCMAFLIKTSYILIFFFSDVKMPLFLYYYQLKSARPRLRAQSFTTLIEELCQEISEVFAFSWCLNGKLP